MKALTYQDEDGSIKLVEGAPLPVLYEFLDVNSWTFDPNDYIPPESGPLIAVAIVQRLIQERED